MANTPRMSFPFPNFRRDPWYDEMEDLVNAIDASIYTSREDRNLVLMEGGIVTWDAGTGVLTWDDIIYLNSSIAGFTWRVQPDSATIEGGEVLYVNLVRYPGNNIDVVPAVSSQVPSTDEAIMLAIRLGTRLYWRDGRVIDTGFSGELFTLISAVEDLATTLAEGNTTGGTDIVLSSGDKITAPDGADIRLWTIDGSADGGGISIVCGDGLAGEGGGVSIRGGEGSSGNVGGDVQITGGVSGDGVSGGGASVTGGEGGTSSSVGGNALIQGGRGGLPNGDGGYVRLVPGAAVGTGSAGIVKAEGDMEVTGKLTVGGLIDPTGIVFDEASAPSTGPNQGAIFVDPADNTLKYRAENDGPIGPVGASSTAMAVVDPSRSDAVDDTDLSTAFSTIQGGVDAIATAGGGTIYVLPKFGGYAETVYVHNPDTHICGVGPETEWGSNSDSAKVVIRPTTTGPAMVYTEATRASAQQLVSRGAANYGTFYDTDLVYGGVIPSRCSLSNIYLQSDASYALCVWGVQSNSTQFLYDLRIEQCHIEGVWSQRVNHVNFRRCHVTATSRSHNVYATEYHQCPYINSHREEYNSGLPVPNNGYYGVEVHGGSLGSMLLYLGSSAFVYACFGFGAIQCFDTSFVQTEQFLSAGVGFASLNVATGAQWQGHGDHFAGTGPLTFSTGGSDLPCTAVDCYIEPSITDANSRLTQSGAFKDNVAGEFNALTLKGTPVAADLVVIEDSAASFAKKKAQLSSLLGSAAVFEIDSGNNEIQPVVADKGRTFLVGSQSTEDTGTAADDSRMFFHKTDYSFRAGRVLGTQWDSASRGQESVAFGLNCIASGSQSMCHGSNSAAQAASSFALGQGVQVNGTGAVGAFSHGNYGKAYFFGQYTHASDRIATPGDAQFSRGTLQAETSGAVVQEMFLNYAATQSLSIPDDRTWAFEILFSVRQVGGAGGTIGNSAAYKALGCIKRVSGVASIVGTVTYTTVAEDDASWPTPVVDANGTNLRVRVTGVANQDLQWLGVVNLAENAG